MIKKLVLYVKLFFADEYSKPILYKKYLGVRIGENVRIIWFPRFGSEPYLVKIGNNVTITRGVTFLTHDGGVALFRNELPGLNVFGEIIIGNNVFIGTNSTIMPNVTIGNNVVVAAGSVVTKNLESNYVYGGIPAKKIKNIAEYKKSVLAKSLIIIEKDKKRRKEQILEATAK